MGVLNDHWADLEPDLLAAGASTGEVIRLRAAFYAGAFAAARLLAVSEASAESAIQDLGEYATGMSHREPLRPH